MDITAFTSEQLTAAHHVVGNCCLLAGPGTGKTRVIAQRIANLVTDEHVDPSNILAVTFTRAAAFELRERVGQLLAGKGTETPVVSTLHAFALGTLLRNSELIDSLPRPIRIADDWEEANIIIPDLQKGLKLSAQDIKDKLHQLSADWQKLAFDDPSCRTVDPVFLGHWQHHREMYGYTLRSELVYRFKRALEQVPSLSIAPDITHLHVDEYQDLNRCDLQVVKYLEQRGCNLFVAGDDDQSIYGFRYAYPDGIRAFTSEYSGSTELPLTTCHRCSEIVLEIAQFVADLDPKRKRKKLVSRSDSGPGAVALHHFKEGIGEANFIALECRRLIDDGLRPSEILILLRSDRNSLYSSLIREQLEKQNVLVSTGSSGPTPIDEPEGRVAWAYLHLLNDPNDSLAWRTLFEVLCVNVGQKKIEAIENLADNLGKAFSDTLFSIASDSSQLPPGLAGSVSLAISGVLKTISALQPLWNGESEWVSSSAKERLEEIIEKLIDDVEVKELVKQFLTGVLAETHEEELPAILRLGSASMGEVEQLLSEDSVNILTMHQAKGLSSDVVFIPAAEDELIPGRQERGDREFDELRLLYVSMTRARHYLCMSYCSSRSGAQRFSGRNAGTATRHLTRFLRDCPLQPQLH